MGKRSIWLPGFMLAISVVTLALWVLLCDRCPDLGICLGACRLMLPSCRASVGRLFAFGELWSATGLPSLARHPGGSSMTGTALLSDFNPDAVTRSVTIPGRSAPIMSMAKDATWEKEPT
jgi:hypothetical protein